MRSLLPTHKTKLDILCSGHDEFTGLAEKCYDGAEWERKCELFPNLLLKVCQSGRWPSLFQQVQIGKERSTPSETKSILFKQEQAFKRCRAQETCFQAVRTCKEKIQAAQKEEVDNLGGILPQGI